MRISQVKEHQEDGIAKAEEVLVDGEVAWTAAELPDAEVARAGDGHLARRE